MELYYSNCNKINNVENILNTYMYTNKNWRI